MTQSKRTLHFKSVVLAMTLLLCACSPESPKLKGFEAAEKVKTTEGAQLNPKVDILFVMDNSASMEGPQATILANIPKFVNELAKSQILDYHIGVLSSTYDEIFQCGVVCEGELYGGSSGVTFVERSTPDGLKILSENLVLGINGGGIEKFYAPVMAALTPPLSTGHNAGFYRPDAALVTIFVTDTNEQTPNMSPQDFQDFLVNLKSGDAKKVITYAAVIPSNPPSGCVRHPEESEPVRIEETVVLGGGSLVSLCDSDFGTKLGQLATDVVQKTSKILYLNRAPDPKSIRVTFGSQVIPNDLRKGWSLDPSLNAIILGDELVLSENEPTGTKIEVNFNAAKFEQK